MDTTNPNPNGSNKGKGNKKSKNKKQVNFTEHPYSINTKSPATRSYYTLVDKIGNSKPLKDKKLQANVLSEVQTFFVEEENFKTLFPTDVKDMDRETLLEFITEAIQKNENQRRRYAGG